MNGSLVIPVKEIWDAKANIFGSHLFYKTVDAHGSSYRWWANRRLNTCDWSEWERILTARSELQYDLVQYDIREINYLHFLFALL